MCGVIRLQINTAN